MESNLLSTSLLSYLTVCCCRPGCWTRCTCGPSACSLLLVLRLVGDQRWPEVGVPPSLSTTGVCWSRCQRIPARQQRERDLLSIPRPVDNSCQCYCGNVLCYGETLQLMRPWRLGSRSAAGNIEFSSVKNYTLWVGGLEKFSPKHVQLSIICIRW